MTFTKSVKMSQAVVDIWSYMTVAELAACVNKETGMFMTELLSAECTSCFLKCTPRLHGPASALRQIVSA